MTHLVPGTNFVKILAVFAVIAVLVASLSAIAPAGSGGGSDPPYIFSGRGRAHGVGMCMDGALYRAYDGWNYHDIINYYYTGIRFGRTDDNQPIRVKGRDGQIRVHTMHDYLYHLQEEPENCPMEDLKVLYVAARTYTLSCIARGKHAKDGYDICSSGNCCQAYDENKNLSKYPKNCAAVDQTTGEIITYDGKPITAAYCGSCGGHTENNEDVWGGNAIPYLRGKPDTYCQRSSRYAWSVSLRKSEVEAKLNAYGDTAVGTLYVMDLSSRTPGGRVSRARITGSAGTKTVTGTTLSVRLGLQSSLFDLAAMNFDEYLLVLNPNPESTLVTFTFMRPDGGTSNQIIDVAANSRYTLKVNDYVQFQEVSTRIVSDKPVVAERAMYFNYRGFSGGSASAGVPDTAAKWYFAEGYTGGAFDTYILVENPEMDTANVRFTFMVPGGGTVERTATAAPCSRMTVHVDEIPGLENTDVSTMVESTNGVGIVADRSMYFNYMGCDDGNSEAGVAATATAWYLAEGYTGGRFDTYVLVQNPGSETASVEATFMREDGANIVKTYELAPHSRYTIPADRVEGLDNAGFSTRVASLNGVGIIAERSMYFDYNGISGGHDGRGVTEPSSDWYFAEGYTGGRFDTWLLIMNPDPQPADVRVTFTRPDGSAVEKDYTIKPNSRFTIQVDAVEGLSDAEASMRVKSLNGVKVIAERAMYFEYSDGTEPRGGGHDTTGCTAPSPTWYFAEGYTGN
ncbi:MAG: SpoIID/LytB domain-containing protein [Actinobacteria bacterium]|nr:SpoIID/LytB domain-containing protein [Actinomycetota bacterium]